MTDTTAATRRAFQTKMFGPNDGSSGVTIPPSFDLEFYIKENPGLGSSEEAYGHFLNVGKQHGLRGSPGCDQGFFVRLIQELRPSSILEIGPGASPKLTGPNVFYFDVKTEAELRERYNGSATIPKAIHFVEKDGNLGIIDQKFDVIFSSHVIEHTSDLVAHLQQIGTLLNDGGYYFVVVPNRKYTFDHFKANTLLEEVVAVHIDPNGSEAHFLKSFLLEEFRRTHNTPKLHWANDHGSASGFQVSFDEVLKKYKNVKGRPVARSGYHRWFFDEDSFRQIIDGVHALGVSPLRLRECYNTTRDSLSFNAIMWK